MFGLPEAPASLSEAEHLERLTRSDSFASACGRRPVLSASPSAAPSASAGGAPGRDDTLESDEAGDANATPPPAPTRRLPGQRPSGGPGAESEAEALDTPVKVDGTVPRLAHVTGKALPLPPAELEALDVEVKPESTGRDFADELSQCLEDVQQQMTETYMRVKSEGWTGMHFLTEVDKDLEVQSKGLTGGHVPVDVDQRLLEDAQQRTRLPLTRQKLEAYTQAKDESPTRVRFAAEARDWSESPKKRPGFEPDMEAPPPGPPRLLGRQSSGKFERSPSRNWDAAASEEPQQADMSEVYGQSEAVEASPTDAAEASPTRGFVPDPRSTLFRLECEDRKVKKAYQPASYGVTSTASRTVGPLTSSSFMAEGPTSDFFPMVDATAPGASEMAPPSKDIVPLRDMPALLRSVFEGDFAALREPGSSPGEASPSKGCGLSQSGRLPDIKVDCTLSDRCQGSVFLSHVAKDTVATWQRLPLRLHSPRRPHLKLPSLPRTQLDIASAVNVGGSLLLEHEGPVCFGWTLPIRLHSPRRQKLPAHLAPLPSGSLRDTASESLFSYDQGWRFPLRLHSPIAKERTFLRTRSPSAEVASDGEPPWYLPALERDHTTTPAKDDEPVLLQLLSDGPMEQLGSLAEELEDSEEQDDFDQGGPSQDADVAALRQRYEEQKDALLLSLSQLEHLKDSSQGDQPLLPITPSLNSVFTAASSPATALDASFMSPMTSTFMSPMPSTSTANRPPTLPLTRGIPDVQHCSFGASSCAGSAYEAQRMSRSSAGPARPSRPSLQGPVAALDAPAALAVPLPMLGTLSGSSAAGRGMAGSLFLPASERRGSGGSVATAGPRCSTDSDTRGFGATFSCNSARGLLMSPVHSGAGWRLSTDSSWPAGAPQCDMGATYSRESMQSLMSGMPSDDRGDKGPSAPWTINVQPAEGRRDAGLALEGFVARLRATAGRPAEVLQIVLEAELLAAANKRGTDALKDVYTAAVDAYDTGRFPVPTQELSNLAVKAMRVLCRGSDAAAALALHVRLEKSGVGSREARLFVARATQLEHLGDIQGAIAVLKDGIAYGACPVRILEQALASLRGGGRPSRGSFTVCPTAPLASGRESWLGATPTASPRSSFGAGAGPLAASTLQPECMKPSASAGSARLSSPMAPVASNASSAAPMAAAPALEMAPRPPALAPQQPPRRWARRGQLLQPQPPAAEEEPRPQQHPEEQQQEQPVQPVNRRHAQALLARFPLGVVVAASVAALVRAQGMDDEAEDHQLVAPSSLRAEYVVQTLRSLLQAPQNRCRAVSVAATLAAFRRQKAHAAGQ